MSNNARLRCYICASAAVHERGGLKMCSACLKSYQLQALGPMLAEVVMWAVDRVRYVQRKPRRSGKMVAS